MDIGFTLGDQDGSEHLSGHVLFTNIPEGVTLSVGHPGAEAGTWEVPQESLQQVATNDHGDTIGWNIPGLTVSVPEGVDHNFDLGIRITTQDGSDTLTSQGQVTVDLSEGVTKTVTPPDSDPKGGSHATDKVAGGGSKGGSGGHQNDPHVVVDQHQSGGSKGGSQAKGGSKGGSQAKGGSKGGDHASGGSQGGDHAGGGHDGASDATVIHGGDGHDVLEITVAHQGNGTHAEFEVQIDGHAVGGGPLSADVAHNHGDWDVIRIEGVHLESGHHTISIGAVDDGGNQVLVDKIAINGSEIQAEDHSTWNNGDANVQGGDAVHVHTGNAIDFNIQTDADGQAQAFEVSDHLHDVANADVMGADGNELFIFGHGGGVDHVDGSATSEGWLDSIHLEGVHGGPAADLDHAASGDWTLSSDHAYTVDAAHQTIDFNSHDASGTITMEDGTKIEFHNVEHIQW
ncbi:MAG: hypothetical protein HQL73_12420 [Magnetococcales bacterium]|nr:hypothetical protein [Magnetococcales bacterium]